MEHATAVFKKYLRTKENLTQPQLLLTATSGDFRGEVDLSWEPVSNANTYIVQKSSSALKPLKWRYEDIVTRSGCTVSNLRSKHCYWFRVAAITSDGRTGWSTPVRKKAP
jgi:hypothetical protein